jgi:hypothetical protein
MFGSMFTKQNIGEVLNGALLEIGLERSDYYVLLAGVIILIAFSLIQRRGSVREKLALEPEFLRYAVYIILFISIITFGAYGIGYDSNQFIYNQF